MNSLRNTEKIEKICEAIKQESLRHRDLVGIYIFGSFLKKESPGDIDVLMVYAGFQCDINNQIDELALVIERLSGYPIDVTALSKNELKETLFLERLNGNYIRIL